MSPAPLPLVSSPSVYKPWPCMTHVQSNTIRLPWNAKSRPVQRCPKFQYTTASADADADANEMPLNLASIALREDHHEMQTAHPSTATSSTSRRVDAGLGTSRLSADLLRHCFPPCR